MKRLVLAVVMVAGCVPDVPPVEGDWCLRVSDGGYASEAECRKAQEQAWWQQQPELFRSEWHRPWVVYDFFSLTAKGHITCWRDVFDGPDDIRFGPGAKRVSKPSSEACRADGDAVLLAVFDETLMEWLHACDSPGACR